MSEADGRAQSAVDKIRDRLRTERLNGVRRKRGPSAERKQGKAVGGLDEEAIYAKWNSTGDDLGPGADGGGIE